LPLKNTEEYNAYMKKYNEAYRRCQKIREEKMADAQSRASVALAEYSSLMRSIEQHGLRTISKMEEKALRNASQKVVDIQEQFREARDFPCEIIMMKLDENLWSYQIVTGAAAVRLRKAKKFVVKF
jgi:tellurite resistance protein